MTYYNNNRRAPSYRDTVSKRFGGLDDDVREIFFALSTDDLGRLFRRYEAVCGPTKRQYAERVYQKWRSGEVRMSGVVSERLLGFLPPMLPPQLKYELVEKLWVRMQPKTTVTVWIRPDTGYEKALDLVRNTVREKMKTEIPNAVRARLAWLNGDDTYMAEDMVKQMFARRAAILRREAEIQIRDLFGRFERERGLKLEASKEIVLGGTTVVIRMKPTPFYRRLFGNGKSW